MLPVEGEKPAAESTAGREQQAVEFGVEREQPPAELAVQADVTASAAAVDLGESGTRELLLRHLGPRRGRI